MQGQNIILVRGVHKTYHTGKIKVHALRGVDLDIRRGGWLRSWAQADAVRLHF